MELADESSQEPRTGARWTTHGTIAPRYWAGAIDNTLAMGLGYATGILVDRYVDGANLPLQFGLALAVFLAYYFAFEATLGRTPGKMLAGLKVINRSGARCSPAQAAIRTVFRLLEVNPILLG